MAQTDDPKMTWEVIKALQAISQGLSTCPRATFEGVSVRIVPDDMAQQFVVSLGAIQEYLYSREHKL